MRYRITNTGEDFMVFLLEEIQDGEASKGVTALYFTMKTIAESNGRPLGKIFANKEFADALSGLEREGYVETY